MTVVRETETCVLCVEDGTGVVCAFLMGDSQDESAVWAEDAEQLIEGNFELREDVEAAGLL